MSKNKDTASNYSRRKRLSSSIKNRNSSLERTIKERDNVDYRLYPKLNHFFTEGDGELSKPDEYYSPANIPEYVINDIATWVQGRSK